MYENPYEIVNLKSRRSKWVAFGGERQIFRGGAGGVTITGDKVNSIRERLKVTQDRQKSYIDKKRRPVEFQVRDRVILKVSPSKGIIRFGK